jgi:hypothetical protein
MAESQKSVGTDAIQISHKRELNLPVSGAGRRALGQTRKVTCARPIRAKLGLPARQLFNDPVDLGPARELPRALSDQ